MVLLPKYAPGGINKVIGEKGNICMEDEILHCVQNDKEGLGDNNATVSIPT
jgi:hypothetical protein